MIPQTGIGAVGWVRTMPQKTRSHKLRVRRSFGCVSSDGTGLNMRTDCSSKKSSASRNFEIPGRLKNLPPPLSGIKVLDFSHALAGPFCTLLLSDYGATVY